jgi:YidC/Oxa1 family membrane protein insertase
MNNRRIQFIIIYLVLYAAVLFLGPRLFPNLFSQQQRNAPSPAQITQKIQTLRDQAAKAEQDAQNTQLSLSDRAKKWDDALRDYREIEHLGGKTAAAIDAKFQQGRVFEERARSDTRNTGDYDQAERIYKDLARHHPSDRATITINGEASPVVVGQYAQDRLDVVLRERDLRSRHNVLYRVLDFFVMLTGRIPGFSYWFALLLITILIKLILFPFTKRQFKNMADMQRIAPKMKEMQEKLKGRPADEINRKVMALYKEEGVNPAAGCVPLIAQMVALIPLYQMIRMYEYRFRGGYFLWIGSSLSHQHPQWIATSLAMPDIILLVLYCISMALTSKLQPPAADPQQAQMQKTMTYFMPVIFGAMTWNFAWPSAFTFYWLVLNLISTAQQWHILKNVHPVAATAPSAAGALPPNSGSSKRGGPGGNGRNGGNGSRPVKPSGSRSGGAKKSSRR